MKYGLKVLAISIALVIASSVAMYGYSETEGGEGISESEGGKGVISLVAPPFIGAAGASPAGGGGGAAAPRAGTSFLEEEAGISAYVNIGHEIDLEKAKTAFKSIETANESYIIGEIDLPGLPEYADPHAYVHKDGWLVAYYSKYAPASKIMQWNGYDGGVITTTTLEDAMHEICLAIEFPFATIKDDIKYYDFEYPNANRMMLIVERTGTGSSSDSFNLIIPVECQLYEGSWSHYFDYYNDYSGFDGSSYLKIDGYTISTISGKAGDYYKYGEYTPAQLEYGVLHEISIEQSICYSCEAFTNTATVLIYRTS